MPRFAILEHDHPHLHWDLLLESGAVALTWRLAEPPCPGTPFDAERIFDHRLLYLDYEGPVSGNRGRVRRWDAGPLDWQHQDAERVEAALVGSRVCGVLRLERRSENRWEGLLEEEGSAGPSVPRRAQQDTSGYRPEDRSE